MARITIDLDDHVWDMTKLNAKRHRFGSASKYVRALLTVLNAHLDRLWHSEEDLDIDRMFDDLGHWQHQPDGNPPITRRQRWTEDKTT